MVSVRLRSQAALDYLPKEAYIRAKIYPVIKPRENSFVFDLKNEQAIFLYLDPTKSASKFENTLAHELHHIGYGTSCPRQEISAEIGKLPANVHHVQSCKSCQHVRRHNLFEGN